MRGEQWRLVSLCSTVHSRLAAALLSCARQKDDEPNDVENGTAVAGDSTLRLLDRYTAIHKATAAIAQNTKQIQQLGTKHRNTTTERQKKGNTTGGRAMRHTEIASVHTKQQSNTDADCLGSSSPLCARTRPCHRGDVPA